MTRPLVLLWAVGMFLQLVVFPEATFGGARPDWILSLAVAVGLLHGTRRGLLFGLLGGLLQDLWLGRYVGLFTLTRAAAGGLAGLARTRLFGVGPLLAAALGFALTLVAEGLAGLALAALGNPGGSPLAGYHTFFREATYDAAIAGLAAWVLQRRN